MRFDSPYQERRIAGPRLIYFVFGNDLILRFLDLHHLAELGGLAGLTLADDFRRLFEDANDLPGLVRVAPKDPRACLPKPLRDQWPHRFQLLLQTLQGGLLEDIGRSFHSCRNLPGKTLRLSYDTSGGLQQLPVSLLQFLFARATLAARCPPNFQNAKLHAAATIPQFGPHLPSDSRDPLHPSR